MFLGEAIWKDYKYKCNIIFKVLGESQGSHNYTYSKGQDINRSLSMYFINILKNKQSKEQEVQLVRISFSYLGITK